MNSSTFGKAGEDAAAARLEMNKWRIIAANYRTAGGELDLVAFRRGVLAFVEVKTRSNESFGTPAEAVDARKRCMLRNAAGGFVYEQMKYGRLPVYSRLLKRHIMRKVKKCRFDIAEVYMTRDMEVCDVVILEDQF